MLTTNPSYTYTDISGLNDLKRAARVDQHAALKDVARQFEGLFMKMMLKSMRDASFGDPIFDNNQSKFYRDMFDNQLALSLTKGRGLGLAETLARQLGQQLPGQPTQGEPVYSANANRPVPVPTVAPVTSSAPLPTQLQPVTKPAPEVQPAVTAKLKPITRARPDTVEPKMTNSIAQPQQQELGSVEKFVRKLWPMAKSAAEELNTKPEVLLAQAALETGWGKYISKDTEGQSSNNLFNIKAGRGWTGDFIEKRTVEFKHGKAVTENARFRAYDSYEDSFRDYVSFLKANKRYQPALQVADVPSDYINKLQQAGYATDPEYANKVLKIMDREWNVFEDVSAMKQGVAHDV